MADSIIESESSSSNAPLNSILVDSSNNAEPSTRSALDLRNLKSLPKASNSSNGKIKRHRPVVRSQSSTISLLRQPPPSASSITSGTDESLHFQMPDQYVGYRSRPYCYCRCWWWCLLAVFTIALCSLLLWFFLPLGLLEMGKERPVCTSAACIKAAARVLARLDPSADPCEDFYQFSCGSFLETGNVPDDSSHFSTLQEMQDEMLLSTRRVLESPYDGTESGSIRKIKDLYTSCMGSHTEEDDFIGVEELSLFYFFEPDQVGPWPLLFSPDQWNDSISLEHLIGVLAAYQVHSFLDIYVTQDERNTSQFMLQFYKGDPLMEKEWYNIDQNETMARHSRYLRSYHNLMEESVSLLSTHHHQQHLQQIEDMLQFETKFAKIASHFCVDDIVNQEWPMETNSSSDDDVFAANMSDPRLNLAEMNTHYPVFNWTAIVDTLLLTAGLNEQDRSALSISEMPINLQCHEFLPELSNLIASTPRRTVVNYLVWRFVFKSMPLVSERFQKMWTHFKMSVPNLTDERIYLSRWKQCVAIVNKGFGLVAAHLYVTKMAANWTNSWILGMIDELKEAFAATIVTSSDWVEEEMTSRLLEKLRAMGSKIGYPSRILNLTQLDIDYEDLEIDADHILFNVMRMRKYEVWREIQKVFLPTPKEKEWLVQPLVVNAFYSPSTNEIIFPLGILREPFYNLELPRYMTYANLGVVIGHEIIHGFDVNGRRYDHNGNMTMWWSESLLKEFQIRADCFIQQYSALTIDNINKKIDGNRTLGENICDSGGLAHAWMAYKNSKTFDHHQEADLPGVNYTQDQLFFINYGQIWCEVLNHDGYEKYTKEVHSPGKYRANSVLQNNQIFAKVFQCPVGSAMNPVNKCQLWS